MPAIVTTWMRQGELVAFGYVWAAYQALWGVLNLVFATQFTMAQWTQFTLAMAATPFLVFALQYLYMRTAIRTRIRKASAASAPARAPESAPS